MSDSDFFEHPGADPPEKPGERLLAARKAQEITRQDVVKRLHLSETLVASLEFDAYDELPTPAYVRGYIRAYARMVDIDAEPLVEAYNFFAEGAPPIEPFKSRPTDEPSANDRPVKIVTYIVIVSLCLLMILWWQAQYGSDNDTEGLILEESTELNDDEIPPEEVELPSVKFRFDEHGLFAPAEVTDLPAGAAEEPQASEESMPINVEPPATKREEAITPRDPPP